jgi:hypothetical protein
MTGVVGKRWRLVIFGSDGGRTFFAASLVGSWKLGSLHLFLWWIRLIVDRLISAASYLGKMTVLKSDFLIPKGRSCPQGIAWHTRERKNPYLAPLIGRGHSYLAQGHSAKISLWYKNQVNFCRTVIFSGVSQGEGYWHAEWDGLLISICWSWDMVARKKYTYSSSRHMIN